MQKIKSCEKYDYYSNGLLYNIVPKNSLPPIGGYRDKAYIEKVKGVKF